MSKDNNLDNVSVSSHTNSNVNKNIISTTEDFPSFAKKFKVRIVDMYKNKLAEKKENTLLGVNKFRYAMSSNRR